MSKKIALLIDSLSSGGAEKMVANLSKSFVDKGYDVTIIIMQDEVKYNYSGNLYNFGKLKVKYSKLKAFFVFKNYFKTQHFDAIIDHRVRKIWLKEFIFATLVFKKSRVIYVVHHYDLTLYFPSLFSFLSKLTIVKNASVIAVSKRIKEKVKTKLNINSQVIYNFPEAICNIEGVSLSFKFIIAVGRLEKIKQFDSLINSYYSSKLPENNIKLLIFGEGSERVKLQTLIEQKQLTNRVELKGFKTNVGSYIKSAEALIMSSEKEGFPMVLIEAVQLKTSVISFNCPSGPEEIISDGVNGILVENQNFNALSEAMNNLVLDQNARNKIMNNLNDYESPFKQENIIKQWETLIHKE